MDWVYVKMCCSVVQGSSGVCPALHPPRISLSSMVIHQHVETILNSMDERKHLKEKYSSSWMFSLALMTMQNLSKKQARKKNCD